MEMVYEARIAETQQTLRLPVQEDSRVRMAGEGNRKWHLGQMPNTVSVGLASCDLGR